MVRIKGLARTLGFVKVTNGYIKKAEPKQRSSQIIYQNYIEYTKKQIPWL